ncbi:ABC-2 family transporter protein [Candidatus Dojkabacteria bacterium]|nr:ABC-2 family transporter protein [Candidatus Dojkabacteria bacterium]
MKISLLRELEHRVHFVFSTFGSIFGIILIYVIPILILEKTGYIAGRWNQLDIVIISSCFAIISSLDSSFFHTLDFLPEQIAKGELDYSLRIPLDSQFSSSVKFFNWDHVPNFFIGILGVIYALAVGNYKLNLLIISSFILALISGIVIFYCLHKIIMILSFWLIGADNLAALFHVIRRSSNIPTEVFGKSLLFIFTYFIPIVFITTYPAIIIKDSISYVSLISALVAILLFIFTRKFWLLGLKSYSGASS